MSTPTRRAPRRARAPDAAAARETATLAPPLVVDPAREAELQGREEQHDQEEHPGERGRVAHVQEVERLAVDQEDVHERLVDRAAAGQDERLGEDLERE